MSKSSTSGSSLDAPDTPKDMTLDIVEYAQVDLSDRPNEYPIHHFYVRCSDLQGNLLPLDANPRRPEETTQVRAMKKTLEGDSTKFVNRNNGIVALATEVNPNEDYVELSFGKGEGICNGGHTLLAIDKYTDDEKALVHLEIIEFGDVDTETQDRQQEIVDIANARNNNNQLEERSEADFLDYYDHFKSSLIDERVVSWHEGDNRAISQAIDAYHFLRMLKSLDVDDYGHPLYDERGKNHSSLATSISRVHNKWKSEMDDWMKEERATRPLRYLTPLTTDLFYIRDMISHHLEYFDYPKGTRRQNLFQEYINSQSRKLLFGNFDHDNGYDLTPPLEVLLTGLFRTNIYLSESKSDKTSLVGWFRDPERLWSDRSLQVINNLQNDFKDVGSDPKKFIRLNGPFNHDFYPHGMGDEVTEEPDIVYEISDNSRYVQVDNPDIATHYLDLHRNPDKRDELRPINTTEGDHSIYRKEPIEDAYQYLPDKE